MEQEYVARYVDGVHLQLSLAALWDQMSRPPPVENALTRTEWGPFYLSGSNAPFVPIFIRTVDRALYHSGNVWRQFEANLYGVRSMFWEFGDEGSIQTHDRKSKYEIEAFYGAIVGVTESNLIGEKGRNRLRHSSALGDQLIARIRHEAQSFKDLAVERKWHAIRNNAYHLNPGMTDWGFPAYIRTEGGNRKVEITNVHFEAGAPSDLALAFAETYQAFVTFVRLIRDLLKDFCFAHIAVPTNLTFYQAPDPLGNMLVALGPDGFRFSHFPETAANFVGPPRPR